MAFLKFANTHGIPCIESLGVSVSTTAVSFNFAEHKFLDYNFQGLLLVRINQTFEAPTTAVPVQFVSGNVATQKLLDLSSADVMSDTFNKTGIYLCFYDRPTNTLQLLSRTE